MVSGIMFVMNVLRGNKVIRRIESTEHQIQAAMVEWSTKVFVDHPLRGKCLLRPYLIKITNEGKRSWTQGKKMKAEGLTKGVSDLLIAFPCRGFHGLWYEVKAPGKIPSDEQLEFLAGMQKVGYAADWGDSVDKGIQDFKDYLGMR
jgi:hypothetical protein